MKHDDLAPNGHAKTSRAKQRRVAHARGKPVASAGRHRKPWTAGREAKTELQSKLVALIAALLDGHRVDMIAEGGGVVARGAIARHLGSPNLRFRAAFPAELSVPTFDGSTGAMPARLLVEGDIVRPRTMPALIAFEAQFVELFGPQTRIRQLTGLAAEIGSFIAQAGRDIPAEWHAQVHQKICQHLRVGLTLQSGARGWGIASRLEALVQNTHARAEGERARALLRLETYEDAFPLARALNRTLHFRLGATNSGKTHEALEKLKEARSGVYLAPLRLLAMEVRDRMVAAGVPCNLMTGEEHDIIPGARHTASTVEMMNPDHEVEVAVIDEIQMLADPSRGWAWTAAIVGAPARDVYVCGSAATQTLCRRAAAHLGEAYSVVPLKRKTPLNLESTPARLESLRRGDALIAFSRKEVLMLSARLRHQGYQVATIYGALAPEVRRSEAERFACGDAEIVVATDAIGMGLNLPIRRVVFSAVQKFDGEQLRPLNSSEVNQIAGRAGRFGLHAAGYVTALTAEDRRYLAATLGTPDCFEVERLPVTASLWHVEQLAEMMDTDNIAEILGFFASRIAVQSPIYVADAMTNATALAAEVQRLARHLPLATRHALSCAPISPEKDVEATWFAHYVSALAAGLKAALPRRPDWLRTDETRHLDEAEQLSKNISLYAWLAFKFPETFPDADEVPEYRHAVSRYIERELLRQGGFRFQMDEGLPAAVGF